VPVRICLLLDSFKVAYWQKSIIEFISSNPALQLNLIVLNGSKLSRAGMERWAYRFLRKVDRLVFKVKHDQFSKSDITEFLKGVKCLTISPKQTKFKDEIIAEDIEAIREHGSDIIIRFGFRILKGGILHVAKHGVWSLHHGDSAVNRGGPPAFWEVVNDEPVTGVTLQVLSDKLDAGMVLGKSFCKTDFTSFNRNQNSVYAAGVELFCSKLNELSRGILPGNEVVEKNLFAATLYRDPENWQAIIIMLRFWLRRFKEQIIKIFTYEQWALYTWENAENIFKPLPTIKIKPPASTDWADPFLFFYQERKYLFFEKIFKGSGKGKIDCLSLDEPRQPTTVISEDYHLSYPTIIENQSKIYLMTEAAQYKKICLYECEEFPIKWKKLEPIVEGLELYDPTIFFYNGLWYLFGTQKLALGTSPDQFLNIYWSPELIGAEWKPHEKNPVTRDVRRSRPAGKIFQFNGKLIRPAQIGAPKYGHGICFMEILTLTPKEFMERPIIDWLPWNEQILATHTFSHAGNMVVTDGQSRRLRFF